MNPNPMHRAADIFGTALGRISGNLPGPGDEATWPPYSGHPNDPRAPEVSTWERAQSIAHDPAQLVELKKDGTLIYADLCLTHEGEVIDLDDAHDMLRLHVLTGRYEDAETLGKLITDELAREVERLIERGVIA